MTLGFSVNSLLSKARGGGQLRMGLNRLSGAEWLQPDPDLDARCAGFAEWPEGVQLTSKANAPGRELAGMLGVKGGLPEAALASHEDMCLLTKAPGDDVYRLIGAAVAWPSDWEPKDKIGLPLRALHAPIQGYEEQLASGVDRFIETLKPSDTYGRCNWFIAPTGNMRWLALETGELPFARVTKENAGETLFVRSERQTLRRLPQTGAIVFTIGIYVAPLGTLSSANIAKLTTAMEDLVKGEGDRRGSAYYADAMIEYFERTKP